MWSRKGVSRSASISLSTKRNAASLTSLQSIILPPGSPTAAAPARSCANQLAIQPRLFPWRREPRRTRDERSLLADARLAPHLERLALPQVAMLAGELQHRRLHQPAAAVQ